MGEERERKTPWDLAKKDKEAKDTFFFFLYLENKVLFAYLFLFLR
jgi:hypothetical protein